MAPLRGTNWLCATVAVICIISLCIGSVSAGRNKRGRPCKYSKQKSRECDPVNNTRNLTMTLKKGDEQECPQTKVITLSCRKVTGCMYDGKSAEWSECDPHTDRRALVKTLVEGSPESCPPTHIRVRRCKNGRGGKGRGKGRGGRKRGMSNRRRKNRKNKDRKSKKERRRSRKERRMKKAKAAARREQS